MRSLAWLATLGLMGASEVVTFDNASVGRLPAGWSVAATHSGAAPVWEVVHDPSAPTAPYVLAQVSQDPASTRFPLAIFDKLSLADADISVRIKPVSGVEDQAGGIVWRYRDHDNYYLVRANALARDVVVYRVVNGQRSPMIAPVKHNIATNTWSILKVTARGPRFAIYVNHRRICQGSDSTFSGAGKVGLWTEADSVTYFDDFRVYPR